MLKILLFLCIYLMLYSVSPQSLFSQSENQEGNDTVKTYKIDEVVITGTRTTKKIIDVPYSIERIDADQYKFARKVAVGDILGEIPGLFLQSRYGNHDVRISIRGFGSRSNSGIRGVRILLDGIPESEPDGQTRIEAIDFHSVGTIEVVKGNSSSLYTNAPGGVINFINDVHFPQSFASSFRDIGSFGLQNSGFKTGIRSEHYRFLTTYNYHAAKGFRGHSEDNWHIVNTVLETSPQDFSHLYIYGYFVDGLIRLPGSLTKSDFEKDPFQPNNRDVSRDAKRVTKKGRVGIRFDTFFGEDHNNELDLIAYGTIKYFERTARTYRLFNRSGVGASARFVNHAALFGKANEFSIGGDLFFQSGPIEEYDNINGTKGDVLQGVTEEGLVNTGFYFQNSLSIIDNTMDFLLTGRYDKIIFDIKNQTLQVQNAVRRFEAFTPKAALNYKFTPTIAVYTSYGLGYDTPSGNEVDNYPTSSNPTSIINPDLQAQKSKNFELGIKGNILSPEALTFRKVYFDFTFFNIIIDDEIVPFEVFGDVFYRNAGRTNRTGLELGANVEIVKDVTMKSSYTFSHFTYDSYTAQTIELDALGNIITTDKSFVGNSVPSVPKHNLSISATYEHKFVDPLIGFIKLNYVHVSGLYVDDENSDKTSGYNLVNST
ncbi:MAG TPA: TonB-dependent receptor, partial [Bacteroidota bacterium]|nr:TonB-dependent receptor [Bacteroidota bacterium]